MDELISKIERVVEMIIGYDQKDYSVASEDLIDSLVSSFTKIISYYTAPQMAEYAEDAAYWPSQLERILSAFNNGDDLALVDVLYSETRANLLELKDILMTKGIIE